jgi:V/A-type H+-transporting ATPase subunit D
MARLTVSATKGNLLKLREEYVLAADALTFLEEKRDLLLEELLRLQAQAVKMRRLMARALEDAYQSLTAGLLALGSAAVARAALGVEGDDRVFLKDRAFLGMPMPVVEFQPGPRRPQFSFGGTVSSLDECQLAIREALGQITALAEVEAVLWRLAEELQRTVRRSNALNYVMIPSYRETIHYLEGALEEREREALFQLKRVKARKTKRA